jgi:hypothetical protein
MRIRTQDPESFRLWIRDGNIRIRDKHLGPATLEKITKLGFSGRELLNVSASSQIVQTTLCIRNS